jgi:hypothetical protein
MNAGCKHQRAEKWNDILLDDSKPKTQDNMAIWTYKKDNPKGLLTEACKKCGYKYGTKWLYRDISKEDLKSIYNLLGIDIFEQRRLKYI